MIDPDHCTGCEACVEICPVDCIGTVEPHPESPGLHSWCEIDWDRCIGCKLCVRVPRKKSDPYRLTVCPWEAIEMVPSAGIVEAVERMGGPPPWQEANRRRLSELARRQVDPARAV
ncbi:MAG: 4Fe-4S binding protein [Planctomycetota bacterium]